MEEEEGRLGAADLSEGLRQLMGGKRAEAGKKAAFVAALTTGGKGSAAAGKGSEAVAGGTASQGNKKKGAAATGGGEGAEAGPPSMQQHLSRAKAAGVSGAVVKVDQSTGGRSFPGPCVCPNTQEICGQWVRVAMWQ